MNLSLNRLIEEGEHQQQDFKYCINDSKKIAKSLVAFANTDGGRLLIGVKDNGNIVGISTDEEFYMVESAAKIYSNPSISFSIREWRSDDKTVLEVTVMPSNKKPHYAKDENGRWIAYTRIDDENVLTHRIQLAVWKKQKSSKGIYFSYSADEKFLIDYLKNNPTITFSKFIRLAHISRKKAEEILSNFVIMKVIKMLTTKEGTIFVLNQTFEKAKLDRFK